MRRADIAFWALLAAAFVPALLALEAVWSTVDYYGHGYLVPVVAAFAAWQQRDRLAGLGRTRDRRGALVLGLALVLYALGAGAGSAGVQGLALVGAVAGGVLFRRGADGLRALAFPIAFLVFMVPLPAGFVAPAIIRLQLFVSAAAVSGLQALDFDVARAGNVILLPDGGSLFVAEACSGVTSAITLTPLAVFLAYFTEPTLARRALLVLAVLPIALAANLARVVGTVLAAGAIGADRATAGWIHESWGLLMYGVGCLALLGVGVVMRWVGRAPEPHPS